MNQMYLQKPGAEAALPVDDIHTGSLNGGYTLIKPEKKSGGLTGIVRNNIKKAKDYIASIKRQHSKGYKEELIKDYLVNKTGVLDSLEIPRKMQESFVYENTKVNKDGSLDTTVLDNRIKTLEFNQAYSEFYRNRGSDDASKTDYNPVKTIQGSNGGNDSGKNNNGNVISYILGYVKAGAAAGSTSLILLAANPVNAQTPDNPGWNMDSNIYLGWSYGTDGNNDLTGTGLFDIINVGSETRTEFWWNTADLLTLTAPSGWTWSYDNNSDLVKLIGQSDVLTSGESITVPFTFNPDNKYLGYGNLDYFGGLTSGTLQNIGTVTVVPEPVSSALFLIGGAALAIRKSFKKQK